MPKYAFERIHEGKQMLGVIAVRRQSSMAVVIEDLLIVIGASEPEELENQVVYVPL